MIVVMLNYFLINAHDSQKLIFSLECKMSNVNQCLVTFLIYFLTVKWKLVLHLIYDNSSLLQMSDVTINRSNYVS